MIRRSDLIPIATVNKTHGIHGELSVTVDSDIELREGACLITEIDGIFVPFFIRSIRHRRADTFLIALDGVDSDLSASSFTGADLFILASDLGKLAAPETDIPDDEDSDPGFFAAALIDASLHDTDGTLIGRIADIDTSTPNTLLIIDRPDGTTAMIPLADDLVASFDPDNNCLTMDIPAGILDLRNI